MWYKGELKPEEYMELWSKIQELEKAEEVSNHFNFSKAQMENMGKSQIKALHDAMLALDEVEELQYQIDEFIQWADSRPY